jgi:hypothetical protein
MFPNYIGACDYYEAREAEHSLSVFEKLCKIHKVTDRKFMIGTMMSYKTLNGLRTPWSSVWLKNEEVSSGFIDHPFALNTLHYADYEKNMTQWSHLNRAINLCGSNLHAIQLDMIWPNPEMIIDIEFEHLKKGVILQINTPALDEIKNDPKLLVAKLKKYRQSLSCVLLDKSMGNGKEIDVQKLLPFLRAIQAELPHIKLAVAGGLGPYNVFETLHPIVQEFPDVSWDAENRLRPSCDKKDRLNLTMCDIYTIESIRLLDRRER